MILVTGMHRSGTSLVAMTMEAIGVDLGDHSRFYEADQWNAKGYFERRDVMDINSRMITRSGRTGRQLAALTGQAVYLTEPRLEGVVARGPKYADQMTQVAEEIGDGAVKDPRFCLTWSAWAEQIDVQSCVVCIRHPYEVADSLRRRQRIPTVVGLRFWRYHMRALRAETPPEMTVVDLGSLIEQPKAELEMLIGGLGLDVDPDEAVSRFHTAYAPGLAKRSATHAPPLHGETKELWNWLVSRRPIPIVGRPE